MYKLNEKTKRISAINSMRIKKLFNYGDTIGIISCSDGISCNDSFNRIIDILEAVGLKIKFSETLFKKNGPFSGTAIERANELSKLYSNESINGIFDISGGESANQILEYIDYDIIKKNPKPYIGISDLSVILNAIYSKTNIPTYHYSIRNLAGKDMDNQIIMFENSFILGKDDIYKIEYEWIKGNGMKGCVVGGNLRCFLKIAATDYIPRPENKILFLESYSGGPNKIASLLTQLRQIGYLNKINGILLGTFSEMEEKNLKPDVENIIFDILKDINISIAKTKFLGHRDYAKCIVIGDELKFN